MTIHSLPPRLSALRDPKLLRQQAYVDGEWVDAESGATIPVNNPATGEMIGTVPQHGRGGDAARDRGGRPRRCRPGAPRPPRSARRSCAAGST